MSEVLRALGDVVFEIAFFAKGNDFRLALGGLFFDRLKFSGLIVECLLYLGGNLGGCV